MPSVVFVNHLPRGSASSFRQEGFAKCLRREGFETTLVCRGGGAGAPGPFSRELNWREPFPLMLLQNARLLAKAIRTADIVHVNRANPFTATLVTMARGSSKAAVVADMEDWDGYGGYSSYIGAYGPKGWALTAFERRFPLSADAVVVVSHLLQAYMSDVGVPRDRLALIHNGFDGDLFRPEADVGGARKMLGLSDSPALIYSSTFWEFERSQHEVAFRALKRVFDEVPGAKLILTGKGASQITGALEGAGIGGRVVSPGFVPRETLPAIIGAADVAVHVIGNDTFHCASSPMIVPEYMAMGKPVVAPRVGELPYLLGGGAGALVDGVDPVLIADAVVEVLRDEGMREGIGRKARMRADRNFSYEAQTVELRRVYERALS